MSSPVPSSLCRAICCYSSGPGLGLGVREGGGGTGRWQEGGTSGQADLFSDFQNHCFMATCSYTSQKIFLSLGAFPVQQGLITSAVLGPYHWASVVAATFREHVPCVEYQSPLGVLCLCRLSSCPVPISHGGCLTVVSILQEETEELGSVGCHQPPGEGARKQKKEFPSLFLPSIPMWSVW